MKIDCSCGKVMSDGGDDLSYKAYLIPDQERFLNQEALEREVIDLLAEGRITKEEAYQRATVIMSRSIRSMWQCYGCGRLFVDGRDRQLHAFRPEGPVDPEILRSRPSG